MTRLEPITLRCRICHQPFVYSPGEQELYSRLGFSRPKACPSCREKARQQPPAWTRRTWAATHPEES